MKQKLLSVLIGITLAVLLLALLRSRMVQAILCLWLLGGLIALCCKIAENFLVRFHEGTGGRHEQN